jgi:hypothetical protein
MTDDVTVASELIGEFLCVADFFVEGGIIGLGASPWGERRVGYISGGHFAGPRLHGQVLPGGGNWSQSGRLGASLAVGTFDARAVWKTDDGAMIYVTYTGRTVVPDDVRAEFADPETARRVDPFRYYLRIAPVFETAHPAYAWLNGVLAIGRGQRTDQGARHHIFAIR